MFEPFQKCLLYICQYANLITNRILAHYDRRGHLIQFRHETRARRARVLHFSTWSSSSHVVALFLRSPQIFANLPRLILDISSAPFAHDGFLMFFTPFQAV